MKSFIRPAGFAVLALAFLACQETEAPTAVSANRNDDNGNITVLYSGSFSDAGILTIVKDPSGKISYSVQAGIGSTAQGLLDASAGAATLANVYRTLHTGDAEVPDAVAKASDQIEKQMPSSQPAQPLREPAPLAKTASESDFKSRYCHDIIEGSYKWRLYQCSWHGSTRAVVVYGVVSDSYSSDRNYAWNATGWTASLWLEAGDGYSPTPNPWRPTLAPYSVTWFSWGGIYENAIAGIQLPAGKTGELGLTNHYRTYWIR